MLEALLFSRDAPVTYERLSYLAVACGVGLGFFGARWLARKAPMPASSALRVVLLTVLATAPVALIFGVLNFSGYLFYLADAYDPLSRIGYPGIGQSIPYMLVTCAVFLATYLAAHLKLQLRTTESPSVPATN